MAIAKFTIEMAADLGQLKRDVSNINDVVSRMGKNMAGSIQPSVAALEAVGIAHTNVGKKAEASAAFQKKMAAQVQYQNLQLANQLQDLGIQIAGGQNPILALVQQGSQLSAVYGGAGNALRAVTALVTPLSVAVSGAALAVVGLGAAYVIGEKQSAIFRKSLELTGNSAGFTTGRFEALVFSVSQSADVGAGKAREMAQAMVSSGRFGSTGFEQLTKTALLMAEITGKSVEDVVQDLSNLSDSPAAWAASRNKSLHFVTDAELKYIQTLEANGRREEAVRITQAALSKKYTEKIVQDLGGAERFARDSSKVWNNLWDSIYGIYREDPIESKIADAMKRLDRARQYAESRKNGGIDLYNAGNAVGTVEAAEAALQKLYDQKSKLEQDAAASAKLADDERAATDKRILQERIQGALLSQSLAKNEANAKLQLLGIEKRILEIQQSASTDGRDLTNQQQIAEQISEQKLLQMATERRKVLQEIATVKAQPQDKPEQAIAVQQQLIGLNSKLVEMDATKLNLQSQAYAGYVQTLQAFQEIKHAQELSLQFVGKTSEQVNAMVFADGLRVQSARALQAEYKNLADGVITLTELEARKANIEREAAAASAAFHRLNADAMDRANNATRGASDALLEWTQQYQRAGEQAKQATNSVLASMEDGFTNFFKTGKLDAKSFVDTLITEFLRLQVVKPLMNNLLSSGGGDLISSIFSAGSKGGINQSAGLDASLQSGGTAVAANGAVFSATGITHTFANGGMFTNQIVTHPKRFAFAGGVGLMGEAGPEAVVPLRRDSRGRLGLMSSGGSSAPNVTVQVINQGGSALQVTGQTQSRGPGGDLNISVLVTQLQDAMADGVASGTGSLYRAIGSRFTQQGAT